MSFTMTVCLSQQGSLFCLRERRSERTRETNRRRERGSKVVSLLLGTNRLDYANRPETESTDRAHNTGPS